MRESEKEKVKEKERKKESEERKREGERRGEKLQLTSNPANEWTRKMHLPFLPRPLFLAFSLSLFSALFSLSFFRIPLHIRNLLINSST